MQITSRIKEEMETLKQHQQGEDSWQSNLGHEEYAVALTGINERAATADITAAATASGKYKMNMVEKAVHFSPD